MSVISIERAQYEYPIDGTNPLKPKPVLKPNLQIVYPTEVEFTPNPKVTQLSEFKERKNREQIMKGAPQLEAKKETNEFVPGFSVVAEASSVVKTYNEATEKGKPHEEAFNDAWKNHEGNLVRYHFEYTMRFPVLVNPVALNEQGDFVNSDSGRRLVDMTSADERNGAVKKAVAKTEDLLKDAKAGDIVIAPSPRGGTGKFINGKELVYGETELFFYEKINEREVRAFTFIADLSYEQTLQVCKYFISPDKKLSDDTLPQQQKVELMTATPFLIPEGVTSAHGFLDRIQEVMGGNIMRKANGANKTFKEAHDLIDLEDDLKLLPGKVQASREVYKSFLERAITENHNPQITEAIEQKMGISLLEDIRIIEGKIDKDSPQVSINFREAMSTTAKIDRTVIDQQYRVQIDFMRAKMAGLGCNNPAESGDSILGQSFSEVLSGYSSGRGGLSGESSTGLNPICIVCRKELCEGKCFNCEKKRNRRI